jgi:hypothetical protein
MRAVIDALLPKGQAWVPKQGEGLDKLLDGIGDNADVIYDLLDQLGVLRDPRLTEQLDDLEKEFGLLKDDRLTEAQRRTQLAAVKYAQAGTGSDSDLQEILQAAGFNLEVHQNSPAIDPRQFIPKHYTTMCNDTNAYCGEPSAVCGVWGGRLLVNPRDYSSQIPQVIMQCGADFGYCGEAHAVCGYFLTMNRTLVTYTIPSNPTRWPFVFFVAGSFSGWTELLDPNMEEVGFLHWLPNINTELQKDGIIRHAGRQSLKVKSNENFQQQEAEPILTDPSLDISLRMVAQSGTNVPMLVRNELLVDGSMELSGVASWTVGNSATLTKQGSAYSGDQCLRVAYNGTANPYAYQTVLTSGYWYRVKGYTRSDGTALPRVRNAGTTLWTGTVDTEWQEFDFVFESGGTTTVRLEANTATSNYCEFDHISVQEIAHNGSNAYFVDLDMEYVGLLDDGLAEDVGIAAWTLVGAPTVTKEDDIDGRYEGYRYIKIVSTAATTSVIYQSVIAQNKTYRVRGVAKSDATAVPIVETDLGAGVVTIWTGTNSHTNWQEIDFTFVKTGASTAIRFGFIAGGIGETVCFDSLKVEEIDTAGIPVQSGTYYWGASSATLSKEIADPVDGRQCLRVTRSGGSPFYGSQDKMNGASEYYRFTGYARSDGVAVPSVEIGNHVNQWTGVNTHTNWQYFDFVGSPGGAGNGYIWLTGTGASGYVEFDKIEISPILSDSTFTAANEIAVPTPYGMGLYFNGSNAWVDCTSGYGDHTDNFTLTAWIKTDGSGTDAIMDRTNSSNDQYSLQINSADKLRFFDGGSNYDGYTSIRDNNWHFVACVINGSSSQLYVDGVSDSATFNPSITSYVAKLGIASAVEGTASWFKGTIVNPTVYAEAKSADHILEIYNRDMTSSVSGPYAEQILTESITSRRVKGYVWSDGSSIPQVFTRSAASYGLNLLQDWQMELSGTTNWTPYNSATLTKDTTNPYSGARCLRATYNLVNNPGASQAILSIGKTYRIRGYARGDGTYYPVVHTGAIIWTGTTSTSWQEFDVTADATSTTMLFYSNVTAAGWVEFDEIQVEEVLEPGIWQNAYDGINNFSDDNALVDGDAELFGVASWTVGSNATLSKSTIAPYSGTRCLKIEYNGTNYPYAEQTILSVGKFYRVRGFARSNGVTSPRISTGVSHFWYGSTDTNWQPIDFYFTADDTRIRFFDYTAGAGYVEFDEMSVEEVLTVPSTSKRFFDVTIDHDFDAIRLISKLNGGGFSNFDNMSIINPSMPEGQVLRERVPALERLILKHKPIRSWCGLIIEEI